MNKRVLRTLTAGAALLLASMACTDVTTNPRSNPTGANVFNDPRSYTEFLARIYGGLQVTGQAGPAGSPDIQGIDEGFSQYLRQYWQLEELPTDEAIIGWGDPTLPELNTQLWGPSNLFVAAMYYRVFFQVMLANEFLRETTDAKLQARNSSQELVDQVHQYRAEARFLRALSYWHGIDLFGNIPLVTEADPLGLTPPQQSTRAAVYDFTVSELNAILPLLPAPHTGEYGRADRGAALMLLAKLYLNSAVYTGTPRNSEARATVEQLINSGGYTLDPIFRHLFQANNHTSPEIIFPVPFDGQHTQTWGGMTFLVHAAVGGNMNAANYGIDGGWWGLRTRPEVFNLFSAADHRSQIFFTNGQSVDINSVGDFQQGVGAPKFTNVSSGGSPGAHPVFPDTDFPMFRLGDAYLMYAEAVVRGGGGSTATALNYVNALRQRAYGDASGNITAPQLTLAFLKDERARELLWEAHRRTDLIRFNAYTSAGIWQWKGGVKAGTTTAAFRNLYPIPATEISANPNLTQNAGY
jgi:starch-binding outer membrane protein, SusD/RagB family